MVLTFQFFSMKLRFWGQFFRETRRRSFYSDTWRGLMNVCDIGKAVLVRLLFTVHSFLTLWRVVAIKKNPIYWYLAFLLWPMFVEMAVSVIHRKGKEYKWFCPSVLFYLVSVIPSIWLLELYKIDKHVQQHQLTGSRYLSCESINERKGFIHTPDHDKALGITLPIRLTQEGWILTLEQLIVFMLILGRWLLPKGDLSRDQLSQILLVYIGTAADIMEIFEAFHEEEVNKNRNLCMAILIVWTWSFAQFTFVLTTSKSKKSRLGTIFYTKLVKVRYQMFIDVMGVSSNLIFQDIPFLILRVILITRYNVHSIMSIFFTTKNSLIIMLELYRLLVLYGAHRKEVKRLKSQALVHAQFKVSPTESSKDFPIAPSSNETSTLIKKTQYEVESNKLNAYEKKSVDYTFWEGPRYILEKCHIIKKKRKEKNKSIEKVSEILLTDKLINNKNDNPKSSIQSTKILKELKEKVLPKSESKVSCTEANSDNSIEAVISDGLKSDGEKKTKLKQEIVSEVKDIKLIKGINEIIGKMTADAANSSNTKPKE